MRLVGLVLVFIACASAVDMRTMSKRSSATPAWAKAVTDAQGALDTRTAEVTKLTGQCSAAKGTEAARKAAYEEAQRNVVAQKVIVAQSTAHVTTAKQNRDTATTTLSNFKAGPYSQAAATWKVQSAKKPDLDARQQKISAAQRDVVTDFPAESRTRATQDLNTAQTALTVDVNAYNNANVAYNAATIALQNYQTALTSAQNTLDAKNTELAAASALVTKLRATRDARHTELKSATAARQTCDQQLTQAKQEVVAAVGHLRTALENQIRALREQLFAAQQNESNRKVDVKTQEDRKNKQSKEVTDLAAEITRITALYNQAQAKLARAIADYTVAQTNYDNAKARTVAAKQSVAQATADFNKFNAANPSAVKTAPAPTATTAPTAAPKKSY